MKYISLTGDIIGCAISVHKKLGPGLLESTYETCLEYELKKAGLETQSQVSLPIFYDRIRLDAGYKLDLLVENRVIVELKSVDRLLPIHEAQLLTYLKLSKKQVGLLLNFNVTILKNGVKRLVN